MSRIKPIRPSHALVRTGRQPTPEPEQERRAPVLVYERRERRRSRLTRTELGSATAEAAFEIHRLANGGDRGIKADMTVRRQWGDAYAQAAQPSAPRPCERGRV